MLWYLWSQNRQEVPEGTYSHDTALSLHELSDIMPSKLHMTVPREFRRNSRIPRSWCFTGHTSTPAKFRKCTGSA
jgi:hypothetical protein